MKTCAIAHCQNLAKLAGLCMTHHRHKVKYGDPLEGFKRGWISDQGYRFLGDDREHRLVAERALGKPLPAGAVVHHVDEDRLNNANGNLVVCPSQEYHALLHRRTDALSACGHADYLKCVVCKRYDSPANIKKGVSRTYHRACNAAYELARRQAPAGLA